MALPKNPFHNLSKRGKIFFLLGLSFIYLLLWTVMILFLPVFYFQWTFWIAALLIAILSFINWQILGKVSLIFIVFSLLILGYSRVLWLEERFCWAQSQAIEASGNNQCLPPTQEEKKNSPEMTCIYQGYRAHMQCHRDFNFYKIFQKPNFNPLFDSPYHPWKR